MSRRHSTAGLALLAAVVGGCYPASPGTQGQQMSDLYRLFFAGGVVVAGIVWGATTWAILRYRRRNERLPVQTHGNNVIEVIWTAIPLLTVLGLFGATYATLQSVNAVSPAPGVQVHVNAFRWQWQFDYTGQGVTIVGQANAAPQLVVPLDEPIHVTLTASDVIHSFYVPALLYKLDAIPGRTNQFDFTVQTPGTYGGACAELCGVFHDRMLFSVRAVTRPEYDAWLASARTASGGQPILASPNEAIPGAPGAAGSGPAGSAVASGGATAAPSAVASGGATAAPSAVQSAPSAAPAASASATAGATP